MTNYFSAISNRAFNDVVEFLVYSVGRSEDAVNLFVYMSVSLYVHQFSFQALFNFMVGAKNVIIWSFALNQLL